MSRSLPCLLSTALLAVLPTAHAQWKPERTVEVVVFSAAGGGNDKTARVMQKIWTENKMLDAAVTNKVGGGGLLEEGLRTIQGAAHRARHGEVSEASACHRASLGEIFLRSQRRV